MSFFEKSEKPKSESKKSVWSIFKGFLLKINYSNPFQLSKYGIYQPFVDNALSIRNYGVIGKTLGEGISSHVYLLKSTPDCRSLAVKIFQKCPKKESRLLYMKALVSEFAVSHTLKHVNILRTLDFVKIEDSRGKFGLVVDFCDQGDLNSLMSHRELEPKERRAFFKQLLHGVKYLHDAGVAHLDLKPDNLLLDGHILKIADFGSCDVFRADGEKKDALSYGRVGTIQYMAPELFTDQGYWGSSADVWSIGIIFFSMYFTGVPFNSARMQDMNFRLYIRTFDNQTYPSFDKLDPEVKTVLYSMLNPDNEYRTDVESILNSSWVKSLDPYFVSKAQKKLKTASSTL